ncbi:MAG: ParA family protein [Chloroflexi bacterium AL-W]|nr:ParA family protein [Chloroflexi bacterium AL-N1]NOK64979.1 ParA family protein [Chloroflexi bacterium AL-N10]NOK76749.1 ParA family protein [Chloroflexi bacterium AL-N5]NOK84640.1 ParA family protein [Chloroflexi bacterium AL-W]NOK86535.1 ParA family protein [Chloroflexi bacterium AL-N15]
MSRVIAISNLKGGIGKTTTVVNVGAGLALKGARVLVVDVDAQGNLAMALGVHPRRTLYEVIVDGARAVDCLTPARPNLDLLAADHTLLGAQPIIAQRSDWSQVLAKSLRPLFNHYDFILIDSGGSLTPLNVNAFVCADSVIAPTAIEHFSLKSIDLLFQQVARVKNNSASIRLIVPTMFDPRVRQANELLEELRGMYGSIVASPIRVNVRLSEAPRAGRTIYEYDPRSRGAIDYAILVERIGDIFQFQPKAKSVPAPVHAQSLQQETNQQVTVAPPAEPVTVSKKASRKKPTLQKLQPATQQANATTSNGSSVHNEQVPSSSILPDQPSEPVVPERTAAADIPELATKKYTAPGSMASQNCPYCDETLKRATVAGYRVEYCERCHYKSQRLAREPIR